MRLGSSYCLVRVENNTTNTIKSCPILHSGDDSKLWMNVSNRFASILYCSKFQHLSAWRQILQTPIRSISCLVNRRPHLYAQAKFERPEIVIAEFSLTPSLWVRVECFLHLFWTRSPRCSCRATLSLSVRGERRNAVVNDVAISNDIMPFEANKWDRLGTTLEELY